MENINILRRYVRDVVLEAKGITPAARAKILNAVTRLVDLATANSHLVEDIRAYDYSLMSGSKKALAPAQQKLGDLHKELGSNLYPLVSAVFSNLKRFRRQEHIEYFMKDFDRGYLELSPAEVERAVRGLESFVGSQESTSAKSSAEKKIEKKAEAGPGDPLGMIPFGEKRRDDVPYEKDTPAEANLHDAIIRHIDHSNQPLPVAQVNLLKRMMSKGIYQKTLFVPINVSVAYRGIMISGEQLKRWLGYKPRTKLPDSGEKDVNISIEPHRGGATSWSKKWGVASKFTAAPMSSFNTPKNIDELEYQVILTAPIEGNDFLDVKKLYKVLSALEEMTSEGELIGLGPTTVTNISWLKYSR